MEVGPSSGKNWSYKTCKAPVKSSPTTNEHTAFYRPDSPPIAKSTVTTMKDIIAGRKINVQYINRNGSGVWSAADSLALAAAAAAARSTLDSDGGMVWYQPQDGFGRSSTTHFNTVWQQLIRCSSWRTLLLTPYKSQPTGQLLLSATAVYVFVHHAFCR